MLKTHERFHSANGKRLILIVDDESVNREMLSLILQDEYQTLTASDGESALALIRETADILSLILLDLLMPGMHGLELLRLLKKDPFLRHIPVIVLTADQEAEVASLKLGASDFIPKPYPKVEVVQTRVMRSIELSEDREIILSTERDALTGLYNTEYFYRYAQQLDLYHKDADMDALVMNIQHFHMISERYGKSYGDELLRHVAQNLRESVKEDGLVCRPEEDTFFIYCPHRDGYDALLETAVSGIPSEKQPRLRMGIYAHTDKAIEVERRFMRAKQAADSLRHHFVKSVALYDQNMHDSEMHQEQLLEAFPTAIKEKQFIVFYQPKFDVRPEIPVLNSAEALVRWQHPTLGMVSPAEFIPLFEDNGLIQELDLYVWRMAAAQIRDWKARLGISVPVSVNVSRVDLYDPNLVSTFQNLLLEFGLNAEELFLEITESAYTQNSDQIIRTVNQLRALGFHIEMDDFGSGYSSLNMISALPIDALKLDMKFIHSAFHGGHGTRLIEIIIDIADYLHVPVIAEGVETEEQLQALRTMGCDIVQGYYFSKPVPPSEYETFVAQKKQQSETPAAPSAQATVPPPSPEPSFEMPSDIASALTSGFEAIYYVDADTGHYVQFSSDGKYEDLQIEQSGIDFFTDTQHNVLHSVYPDDQARVALSLQKEALSAQLLGGRSFSMTYRLVIDGKPIYYCLKAVRAQARDDPHIVIGISNLEEQLQGAASPRAMEHKSDEFMAIAHALTNDFERIYYVSLQTDAYTLLTSQNSPQEMQRHLSGTGFFRSRVDELLQSVHPEDRPVLSLALKKETLLSSLQENSPFSIVYRLTTQDTPLHYQMKIVLAEDGAHLVIGISNITDKIARDQAYEASQQSSITYSKIAQALSRDYYSVYIVNADTDAYTEYTSDNAQKELQIVHSGANFFEFCRGNVLRNVYREDLAHALSVWDKTALMQELADGKTFSVTYRYLINGTPIYSNSKIILTKDEETGSEYIIIGISNVDAQIRREHELAAARDKANRDALTGVKSKHAYMEAVSRWNPEIQSGTAEPFAVAVCDINDLKTVNDTKGHQAGDLLIKQASQIICEIFRHSPVYRVGGDEFVSILRGRDFEILDELLHRMHSSNEHGRKTGQVIIACGVSVYDKDLDDHFEAVFERADAAMYENKRYLKQI